MDEAKRMEEGFNTPRNEHHEVDLKQETKTSDGGIIEHDKDTKVMPEEEPVQQAVEQQQSLVKQKTKRVATLDAFRGLTIVVSVLQTYFCKSSK